MSYATVIIICSIITIESVFILIGNIFTIYVFWINRKRLKRTSLLLINLTVADLAVGVTEPITVGTKAIHRHFKEDGIHVSNQDNISAIAATFSCVSLFFLAFISLERAYAVIWPLRHRVATNKSYICSIAIVWATGFFVGAVFLLTEAEILSYDISQYIVCPMIYASLTIICGSYLSIRNKLYCRVPAINRSSRNDEEQNIKLSKTLFIVIAASCVCWLPSSVLYLIYAICKCVVTMTALYSATLFNIANSFVNPIIYSFKMPIFKELLKKLKPKRTSRNYRINSKPGEKCKNNVPSPIAMVNIKEIPDS